MEYDAKGPLIKPLLLLGEQADANYAIRFPNGLLAFELALQTLHSAIPSADTIYISVCDEIQVEAIRFRVENPGPLFPPHAHSDHDHEATQSPRLEIIFYNKTGSFNASSTSSAGLHVAHDLFPYVKWLVLGSGYPLLPPPALQQLILELEDPVTCFVREDGILEPWLGIWGCEAPKILKTAMGDEVLEVDVLKRVFEEVQGKQVKPLREEWLTKPRTKKDWDDAIQINREIRGVV
ncbi:uncharacterized protein RSE6_03650 [Rhynchosporium secalis]|uniref:Uncharacterized protein n=1 Tax=Rhynchosporium secalis TaxID=38038 RepID=A0A1E1M3B8_RHYSE|nr:uncharacterized protein RSE6_03650 [Rhynchosporium secalis]